MINIHKKIHNIKINCQNVKNATAVTKDNKVKVLQNSLSDFNTITDGATGSFNTWLTGNTNNSLNDKNRLIHTYFWNILDNIEKKTMAYLAYKNSSNASLNLQNYVNSETQKVVKKNNEKEKEAKLSKRLAKYYKEDVESYKDYTWWVKHIYYVLLAIIFVVFLIKKQFKNLKVLFFIILLFLISYTIQPIYGYIADRTYTVNRVLQLGISYLFLLVLFGLFISFKNFVFADQEEDSSEGKRDSRILMTIVSFGFSCMLMRFLFFDKGFKMANLF
tara:strand:+ start:829 stop:1653 length:825 start_codon:yes stop_codon:yes gene_type:complete